MEKKVKKEARAMENEDEETPWWAKNRLVHFVVVFADLFWRVIKRGADIKDCVMVFRVSWNLTKKEAKAKDGEKSRSITIRPGGNQSQD